MLLRNGLSVGTDADLEAACAMCQMAKWRLQPLGSVMLSIAAAYILANRRGQAVDSESFLGVSLTAGPRQVFCLLSLSLVLSTFDSFSTAD